MPEKIKKEVGCECCRKNDESVLNRIVHYVNTIDWSNYTSEQGYQVFQCTKCKSYWGLRYQSDPGTGDDDHWYCFGKNYNKIYRHY